MTHVVAYRWIKAFKTSAIFFIDAKILPCCLLERVLIGECFFIEVNLY